MLYGGLEASVHNQKRKRMNLKLYELGKSYRDLGESKFEEIKRLGIWMTGDKNEESWQQGTASSDFYLLKEKVESVLNRVGVSKYKAESISDCRFLTSVEFAKGKNSLVVFGQIATSELKKADGKEAVYYAEFNWDVVLRMLSGKDIQFKVVSKFPSVRRDLALLIDESIAFEEIKSIAKKVEQRLLKEVNLFDVY
jgi:phenylalanyl-tRNA synthetase beta chain